MRSAGDEAYAHIRYRRTRQHAGKLAFRKLRQYEPLPVAVERILGTACRKFKTLADGQRRQLKMHLGVMPQRFKVTRTRDRSKDRLTVHDAAPVYAYVEVEALLCLGHYDLGLHFAHEPYADLLRLRLPDKMQRRLLVLKRSELFERRHGVGVS